jgi:hypothetical protein
MTLFVLNNNTIYCSIFSAEAGFSVLVQAELQLVFFLTLFRFRERRTPLLTLPHFLLPQSPPSEINFNIFPHRTIGALVQSNVTGIGYYIRSRLPYVTVLYIHKIISSTMF